MVLESTDRPDVIVLQMFMRKVRLMHTEAQQQLCRQQGVEAGMGAMLAMVREPSANAAQARATRNCRKSANTLRDAAQAEAHKFMGRAEAFENVLGLCQALLENATKSPSGDVDGSH